LWELTTRANAHRDGLATAFDPLREQIESLKANFWEKNQKSIEDAMERYIVQKVKERVAIEVSHAPSVPFAPHGFNRSCLQVERAIKRYRDYAENNEQNNEDLKVVMNVS